jgi:hypothetical protein
LADTAFPPPPAAARPDPAAPARRRTAQRNASAIFWTRVFLPLVLVGAAAGLVVGFDRALAALVLLGFAASIAGLARPALGLIGIGLLCALDGFARTMIMTGGLLRWNTFNYWLLVVMLVNVPGLLRLRDPHSRLLALFIVVLVLGIVVSPLRSEGFETTLSVTTAFGLLVYALRAVGIRDAWTGLGLVTGTASAAMSFVFLLQRDRFPAMNPNVWVFCPLTGIFAAALALPAVRRRGPALVLALLAAVDLAWVCLTGSRGGIVLGALGMLYVFLQVKSGPVRVALLGAAVVIAAVLTARFAGLEQYTLRRVEKVLDANAGWRERTSGRSELMLGAWYMFRDHPLGVGTGGFAPSWAKLGIRPGMSDYAYGAAKEAHAAWAKTLAENGIVGFLLLLSYVGSFAFAALRRRASGAQGLGWLTSAVLIAAFFSTEFAGKGLWLLAGSSAAFLWYLPHPAAGPAAGRR